MRSDGKEAHFDMTVLPASSTKYDHFEGDTFLIRINSGFG